MSHYLYISTNHGEQELYLINANCQCCVAWHSGLLVARVDDLDQLVQADLVMQSNTRLLSVQVSYDNRLDTIEKLSYRSQSVGGEGWW